MVCMTETVQALQGAGRPAGIAEEMKSTKAIFIELKAMKNIIIL